MPLWDHLFESHARSSVSGQRSARERGLDGASPATPSTTARPMATRLATSARRPSPSHGFSNTTTAGNVMVDSSDSEPDLVDDGPLHKLTAAYHQSLESTASAAGGSGGSRGRSVSGTAHGPCLVVRERQHESSHGLYATESRQTRTLDGRPTRAAVDVADGEAYDLGLDAEVETDGGPGSSAAAPPSLGDDAGRLEAAGEDVVQDAVKPSQRLRDRPWTLLRSLTRSSSEKRRHILSPDEGSSVSAFSRDAVTPFASLQGPSLSLLRNSGTGAVVDDEFGDAVSLAARSIVGEPESSSSSLSASVSSSSSSLSPVEAPRGTGMGRVRRVDLSVGGGGMADGQSVDDNEAYDLGVAAEVAVLRLDDEFYTSSELAQWRRLQSERVGAGFVATTPATAATTSDGSFPSSLCTRTVTTTSSGDAVLVMRSASDASSSLAPSSELSDGPPPVTQSHIRHVPPALVPNGRAEDSFPRRSAHSPQTAAAADTTTTTVTTASSTPPRPQWGQHAQMESIKAMPRLSLSSEGGLTNRSVGGGYVSEVPGQTSEAAAPQRRLSRPTAQEGDHRV